MTSKSTCRLRASAAMIVAGSPEKRSLVTWNPARRSFSAAASSRVARGLADGDQMAIQAAQQGLGCDVADRLKRAGPAVKCDEKTANRTEIPRRDPDRDVDVADDVTEISAELATGGIRFLAAFT